MKKAGLILVLLSFAFCLQAQNLSFATILDGVSNPADSTFRLNLRKGGFKMISPYKNRMKPETWAFSYNPASGGAAAWVNYYFNSKVLEKKNRNTTMVELTVRSFGPGNRFHTGLEEEIKENCKFNGTLTNDTDGYWYNEYVHESGAYFQVYTMNEENYIKVRHQAVLK